MRNEKFTIGIIGGTGGMGALFADFFIKAGHHVIISSRRTPILPIDCAKQSDIVIITVPISSTIDVIKNVAPHVRNDAVIMDFTSLKQREVETMLQYSTSEVIGCHPVFGPSVNDFRNQVIVLTPARGDKWLPIISDLFSESGAIITIADPKEHDRIMAVVQGLIHFTSITLISTLRAIGSDFSQLSKFSSPVYRIRTDFAARILNQNPELYADIELNNPEIISILQTYIESSQKLMNIVTNKDKAGFIDFFNKASDYLGTEKVAAEERTDILIRTLSNQ